MIELHDVHIRAGEEGYLLRANACAVSEPVRGAYGEPPSCRLYILSAIGAGSAVKAAAAMLNRTERHTTSIRFPEMPEHRKWWGAQWILGHYSGVKANYTRLAMDTWQLLAIAKDRQLVVSDDDESIWQYLKGEEFTTPMLRSWLPEIAKQLRQQNYLQKIPAFGCSPCRIGLVQDKLDSIVSTLVGCGALAIGDSAQGGEVER